MIVRWSLYVPLTEKELYVGFSSLTTTISYWVNNNNKKLLRYKKSLDTTSICEIASNSYILSNIFSINRRGGDGIDSNCAGS